MKISPKLFVIAGAAFLVGAALAAYANTLTVPLLFDDLPSILDNPSILAWRTALTPPRGFGFTVSGRPLLNLSLAANHALDGFNVRGYHVLNLLIHAAAGLTLFGLARRTMRRPILAPTFGEHAGPAAFALALLWTLHPLQTEAVTYIIQRAEALMGWFFLLTLYCFVRATEGDSPDGAGSGRAATAWFAGAVVACALGTGCKEVMAVAPIVVLLYDRTFVAGNFHTAWRSRRRFYTALFATWLPLAWFIASTGGDRGGTFQFTAEAFVRQWRGQCEALLIYLKLAMWPAPLALDYGQFHLDGARLAGCAAVVTALLAATVWALRRRPVAGFFAASFFAILAPTSLMPGSIQTVVEHRMYLPLAAILALLTGGAVAALGRRGVMVCVGLAIGAGLLTARRNADYASDLSLWRDTVAKRPGSAIAQSSLGTALYERGRFSEALACYEASLRLDAAPAQIHFNLGLTLEALGRRPEAMARFTEATRILPYFAQAQAKLGTALLVAGRAPEAIGHLRVAAGYLPQVAETRNSLGLALAETGEFAEAIASYGQALRLNPDYAEAECNWGAAAFRLGRLPEAEQHLLRAGQLQPGLADAHFNLGLVAAARGRDDEAFARYAEAVRLDANHGEARLNLGIALARAGKLDDALVQLREAARLRPALAEAQANLGIVLAETGRIDDAIASYEQALRLRPDYAQAHYNLGNALIRQQRWGEARTHFAEAVRLAPDLAAAREMLMRLESVPPGH